MLCMTHNEEDESEEEEGEWKEKQKNLLEESEEEDLVLQYGEESDDGEDSEEIKKRRKSEDEDPLGFLDTEDCEHFKENLEPFRRVSIIKKESEEESELHVQDLEEETVYSNYIERNIMQEGDSITDGFVVKEESKLMNVPTMMDDIFTDEALQEAKEIFGIDFVGEIFGKYVKDENEKEDNIEEQLKDAGDTEKPTRLERCQRESTMKTILKIYETSRLKCRHIIDKDNEVYITDIPERMQLRSVPVRPVPEGSPELDLEARWIYEQAFCKRTISVQELHFTEEAKKRARDKIKNGPHTIVKIKKALDLIRNQHFEVPFIAFYRKEYVLPELDINDLWKVYKFDAKWSILQQMKEYLLQLFEKIRNYQLDEIVKYADSALPDNMRVIKEDDIERVKNAKTSEEIYDIYCHFKLHYNHDVLAMEKALIRKKRKAKEKEKNSKRKQLVKEPEGNGEESPYEDVGKHEDQDSNKAIEQLERSDPYSICKKARLDSFIKKFGLPPEDFAENLHNNCLRNEVIQERLDPLTVARKFCGKQLTTPEKVLKAAQFMVAIQLSCEPLVRKTVRNLYMERATFSVRATKKGMKEINENHPVYRMKYLKNKPVRDLTSDQFLQLTIAEHDELITITFSNSIEGFITNNYIDEVKQYYYRDEFSKTVQEWNALRVGSVEMALTKMVIPSLKKELRSNLLIEAKDYVMRVCCRKIHNWIRIAPYAFKFSEKEDVDWNIREGIRVMGIAHPSDECQASYACIVAPGGECTDFLKLSHILKRKNSLRGSEKFMKEADLLAIRTFIVTKKPHVVVIGGESRDALMIQTEIQNIIECLMKEQQFPAIEIEICDNNLAKMYAISNRGIHEFQDYSIQLREAISLARRLQDPLVEFSQLCTFGEKILNLECHPLQDHVSQEELLDNIYLEFINQVNEVGVEINKAAQHPYYANLLQFVTGLGHRTAESLIEFLTKHTVQKLENRAQLVTICNLRPKIFINCAGFIKIDTNSLGINAHAYVEILDSSRIHPENYEWARKMAADALEYDDERSENPNKALAEIFKTPEKLEDLDLDAFANELSRQGFGNKSITLYDIRAELSCRYKDLREPYKSLHPGELFHILTKETAETFYVGKLILAKVIGISYKKTIGEQLDNIKPLQNEETKLWQCPFCFKNDIFELSQVWCHINTNCPGKAIGVKLRLDNGLSGYIHVKNLSDKNVTNPKERVCINQPIHCRITKIDVEKFGVECTSRSKDLADKDNEWRPSRDLFYDKEADEKDRKREEEAKRSKLRQAYIKRIIDHPNFYNIDFAEAEKLMKDKKPGDIIMRPSSKGPNNLTVTWKITDYVNQHIDVKEEGKASDFVLGSKLRIGNEEFEDLEEIITKHVNPMISFVNEIFSFKYYKPLVAGSKDRAEEILKTQKKGNPSSIPYIISTARSYPGNFLLSYLPRTQCRHEYFSVISNGFKFRTQVFGKLNDLVRWFKEHFKESISPQVPSTAHIGTMFSRASPPGVISEMTHEAIQKVAPDLPHHISDSLSQLAKQTGYPVSRTLPGYDGNNSHLNSPYLTPRSSFLPASISPIQTNEFSKPQPVSPAPGNNDPCRNKFSQSSTTNVSAAVFDDTKFTLTKKPKMSYDNGVGGPHLKFIKWGKKHTHLKPTTIRRFADDRLFDDPIIVESPRESNTSKDSFDDYQFVRGSPRDTSRDRYEKSCNFTSSPKHGGDHNPFSIEFSRESALSNHPSNSLQNSRKSFKALNRESGSEGNSRYSRSPSRDRRYSLSPSQDRSPYYKKYFHDKSELNARDRSSEFRLEYSEEMNPRFGRRSSWDRSPIYNSYPSQDRSSWSTSKCCRERSPNNIAESDREKCFNLSPPRNRRSDLNSRCSRNRSPNFSLNHSRNTSSNFSSRHFQDRSPGFNRSPSQGRSSNSTTNSSRARNLSSPRDNITNSKSLPCSDFVDNDNPFIMGSSKDKSMGDEIANGNSDRESPPAFVKGVFTTFHKGRGRGFKFRGRGRGLAYDIVSPRDSIPDLSASNDKPFTASYKNYLQEIKETAGGNPFLLGSSRDPTRSSD